MNELQLVTFEQAKKLKELGFDWKTHFYYVNNGEIQYGLQNYFISRNTDSNNTVGNIDAPSPALALKWFRDVKNQFYDIGYSTDENNELIWCNGGLKEYKTYEEAESALLDRLIKSEEAK
jgi:hypothetical protein